MSRSDLSHRFARPLRARRWCGAAAVEEPPEPEERAPRVRRDYDQPASRGQYALRAGEDCILILEVSQHSKKQDDIEPLGTACAKLHRIANVEAQGCWGRVLPSLQYHGRATVMPIPLSTTSAKWISVWPVPQPRSSTCGRSHVRQTVRRYRTRAANSGARGEAGPCCASQVAANTSKSREVPGRII